MQEPRNALGILLMAAGFFTFSIVDTGAKFLTAEFHPMQIVWARQLGIFALAIYLLVRMGLKVLYTPYPKLQVLRGVLAICSATAYIYAVRYIPIADAVAISFVAPFFVTLMGAFILKEKVGIRRWIAITLGFIGALIIIRPGLGVMHPAAFLVVLAAFAFAIRQILSRYLSASDTTETTLAYSALVGMFLIVLALPFVWVPPTTILQYELMAMIAVLAVLAEFLIIKALEVAEAVAVAPVHYSMMIYGTLWGYVVFGDLPDLWTWIGAIVIILTGIYTMLRERKNVKKSAAESV